MFNNQIQNIMATDYIIPTRKNPVFTAVCEDFGYIESTMHKQWNIRKEGVINHIGNTFALTYFDAVRYLHEWIQENSEYVKGLKNIKFKIEMVDGSFNEYAEVTYKEVYSITSAKARKVQLV